MSRKIYLLMLIMLLTESAGYSMPAGLKTTMVKFSYAMGGVILSSVLIFAGLTIYNKIRVKFNSEAHEEEEILRHPKTKDEAIKFYIRKNKI